MENGLNHTTALNLETISRGYERTRGYIIEGLPVYKTDYSRLNFETLSNLQFSAVSTSILLKRPKSEVFTHMFYALQFGINHFKLAMNPAVEVKIEIGSLLRTMSSSSGHNINFDAWQRIFYLSYALRNSSCLQLLYSIPTDRLKEPGVTSDELDNATIDIMKSVSSGIVLKESLANYWKILPVVKTVSKTRDNYYKHLVSSPMKVLQSVLDGDEKVFNIQLNIALNDHYEFYKKKREDFGNPGDSFGWVAYNLLWVVIFAYEQGMKTTIESDYLPRWIIEGDFSNCKLLIE